MNNVSTQKIRTWIMGGAVALVLPLQALALSKPVGPDWPEEPSEKELCISELESYNSTVKEYPDVIPAGLIARYEKARGSSDSCLEVIPHVRVVMEDIYALDPWCLRQLGGIRRLFNDVFRKEVPVASSTVVDMLLESKNITCYQASEATSVTLVHHGLGDPREILNPSPIKDEPITDDREYRLHRDGIPYGEGFPGDVTNKRPPLNPGDFGNVRPVKETAKKANAKSKRKNTKASRR